MADLTILYVTASEMPQHWVDFQLEHLLKSARGAPIVSLSRKPMDLGTNLTDYAPKSYWNIYLQLLRGAKLAKTPYVAVAEDDVLYTPEHFYEFRPPLDAVAFDRSRWSLFAWEPEPIYCLRQRLSNCAMVASREYLIDCLQERVHKWPDGAPQHLVGEVGRTKVDSRLKVTVRKPALEWWCVNPIVHLNHPTGTDAGTYGHTPGGRRLVKKHGQVKAISIPYWGEASNIASIYHGR